MATSPDCAWDVLECPHCGATLSIIGVQTVRGGKCWLCGNDVHAPASAVRPGARPTPPLQFGISSLLLFTTLCAICLSITSMNPGLGVMLAVLAAPALVRTCLLAARRSRSGEPMSAGGKVGVFLVTLSMVCTVIVAAAGAFFVTAFATCAVGGVKGEDFGVAILGLIFGLAAAVTVAILLILLFMKLSRNMPRNRG